MTCVLTIQITPVEKQLFTLIAQEYSAKEISDILSISPYTAEKQIQKLLNKTGCKKSTGLVKFAYDNKILTPEK